MFLNTCIVAIALYGCALFFLFCHLIVLLFLPILASVVHYLLMVVVCYIMFELLTSNYM